MRGHSNRGRGGMARGTNRVFIPHIPFDFIMCEHAFPRVKPAPNDEEFTQALIKCNQDLNLTSTDQATLLSLVTKVCNVLDAIIVSPPTGLDCQIDECRQVGSFKKGTMLSKKKLADVVVILKSMPTKTSVHTLGEKMFEMMKANDPNDNITFASDEDDSGFTFTHNGWSVRVLATTLPSNMRKLDPAVHVPQKKLQGSLAAIRHVRWFEENAFHSSIKMLVRLLKHLREHFEGLQPLTVWIIELLAHHAVMNTPNRQPLSINASFRRCLELLSSGYFLPGSAGIVDPCESGNIRAHTVMTLEEQDKVCYTAQTLLRVLAHGGYKRILDGDSTLVTTTTIWNGVVVTPSDQAYEKVEKEDEVMDISAS